MSSHDLARFLKSEISKQKISIAEVSRKSRLSRESIYKLLRAETEDPGISTVLRLSAALDCNTCEMIREYVKGWTLPAGMRREMTINMNTLVLIRDVTIAENTVVAPSTIFRKIWQVRNIGNQSLQGMFLRCQDEQLIIGDCHHGIPSTARKRGLEPLSSDVRIRSLEPGESTEIQVDFTAPPYPCTTLSYWQFVDEKGNICFPDEQGLACQVRVLGL